MKHPLMPDDQLREALEQVRDMFVHQMIEYWDYGNWNQEERPGRAFNINATALHGECGTIACIGGWAWLLTRATPVPGHPYVYSPQDIEKAAEFVRVVDNPFWSYDPRLHELFYPPTQKWGWISTSHAVQAIDNYLKHGDPLWHEIEDQHFNTFRQTEAAE